MKKLNFTPDIKSSDIAYQIETANEPVEITVSGFHYNRFNCNLLMPIGSTDVTWVGQDNPSFVSSFGWDNQGITGWSSNGDGTYSTIISWSGGPSQSFGAINVANQDIDIFNMLCVLTNQVRVEGQVLYVQNSRLDHFKPGQKIHIRSNDTASPINGVYTVADNVTTNVQKLLIEEPIADGFYQNTIQIKLANRGDLLPGQYMMEYAMPTTSKSLLTVHGDDIGKVLTMPFLSPLYLNGDETNIYRNIEIHGIKIVNAVGTMKNTDGLLIDNCHFDKIAGKALHIQTENHQANNLVIKNSLVTRCKEGFYDTGGPIGFMDGFYVGYTKFQDMNHWHPNDVPAADGHSIGWMNGRNKIAEYCTIERTQGIPCAWYPWGEAPKVCDNVGFRHIYVDTSKEYIPGTAGSIQGIAMNGDKDLQPNIHQNQFIEDCVVRGIRGHYREDGRYENGEAIRYKTADSGSDETAMQIARNFVVDSDIAYRFLQTTSFARVNDVGNTSLGCKTNKKYSTTVHDLDNCQSDFNHYDAVGLYEFEYHGEEIGFETFKQRAAARLHPQANESNSQEYTDLTQLNNELQEKIAHIISSVNQGTPGTLPEPEPIPEPPQVTCEEKLVLANDKIAVLEAEKTTLTTENTSLKDEITLLISKTQLLQNELQMLTNEYSKMSNERVRLYRLLEQIEPLAKGRDVSA